MEEQQKLERKISCHGKPGSTVSFTNRVQSRLIVPKNDRCQVMCRWQKQMQWGTVIQKQADRTGKSIDGGTAETRTEDQLPWKARINRELYKPSPKSIECTQERSLSSDRVGGKANAKGHRDPQTGGPDWEIDRWRNSRNSNGRSVAMESQDQP